VDNRILLHKRSLRDAFDRAAERYDEVAVLQREVGERIMERLQLVRISPQTILDVGAGTGVFSQALSRRYAKSRVLALDIAPRMLLRARRRKGWFSRQGFICGDADCLPIASASVDLIFSNFTLQWCGELDRAFAEFRRVLKPGGLLMFSTLGPDTLKELRQSWQAVDGRPHVHQFIDMHDVGDALLRAGLSDPVMDVENFTLAYDDAMQLMRELKIIGAHNAAIDRPPGLTGKGSLKKMLSAYEELRRDGVLPATYEVVYGHAWGPLTTDNEVRVAFP